MELKKCNKCDSEKELVKFGKDKTKKDGLRTVCKECGKKYDSKRRRTKERKEYMKSFYKWYLESGKAAEVDKKYRKSHPKKYAAHKAVSSAIRNKTLIKSNCEICGCKKVQAHHDNYNNFLDVRWLCAKCHAKWHLDNGEGENAT